MLVLILSKDNSYMEIINRKILFKNPEVLSPKLSHNGKYIACLKDINNVLKIAGKTLENNDYEKWSNNKRNITSFYWSYDNRHLIYLQDDKGNENFQLYVVDTITKEEKALTNQQDTRVILYKLSDIKPNIVIVGINDQDPQWHNLYQINIITGEKELIFQNKQYLDFTFDENLRIRFAYKMNEEGGTDIYVMQKNATLKYHSSISFEDTAFIIGFTANNHSAYWLDNRERNHICLMEEDIASGKKKIIASDPKADINGILLNPNTKVVEGWSSTYIKEEWCILEPAIMEDIKHIEAKIGSSITIISRTLNDELWTLSTISDTQPKAFYMWDKVRKSLKFLHSTNHELYSKKLTPMEYYLINTKDKFQLVSYISWPKQLLEPVPLILWVHGGPRARDYWGFNVIHQWLTNRGYAVLSVNYRGSKGFGKNFMNAGNHEWGGKMHDDLIEAAQYFINTGKINPKKIAIAGGSYGGYAALVGLTFTPQFFACAVDIVGPSNLNTLIGSIPEYWKPAIGMLKKMIGDPSTAEGKKLLEQRSPLNKVDMIEKPLLIQQGLHDPRVKVSESRQIVSTMKKKNIPVEYIEFQEEGHGFLMPNNKIASYSIIEKFFSKHLGGKLEQIDEEDLKNSNFITEVKENSS